MRDLSIPRGELVSIMEQATHGITASTRERLMEVAQTTDAVAVGWFHCDGVHCPARQAGRNNQPFQETFDRVMGARYGIDPETDNFVVRVTP